VYTCSHVYQSLSPLHLTEISEKGEIVYSKVDQENLHKLEAHVEEMASADQISGSVNVQKIQDDVVKLWNVVMSQPEISEEQKGRIEALYAAASPPCDCSCPSKQRWQRSCPGPSAKRQMKTRQILHRNAYQLQGCAGHGRGLCVTHAARITNWMG
jgi:hypothetical protein